MSTPDLQINDQQRYFEEMLAALDRGGNPHLVMREYRRATRGDDWLFIIGLFVLLSPFFLALFGTIILIDSLWIPD